MKSFFYITVLFFSISMFAQKPNSGRMDTKLSPEQQAELQTKKIALTLDLNEKQIKAIQKLETERAKAREANRELRIGKRASGNVLSQEERFAKRSKQLDARKEHQDKMKKILTEEQYTTWKEMIQNRNNNRNSNMKNNKSRRGNGTQQGNRGPR